LLVVTVEDEVTGTGALVHRLIFGITEKGGKAEVLRDWELLQLLNTFLLKNSANNSTVDLEPGRTIERLKSAFDANLSSYVSTLQRPVSWSEMLLIPSLRPAGG
jgi:hypothetical protein